MRAFTDLWDRICPERYGVTDQKLRRFRYGVQVNSLGLTEAQPENNVPRIVLESLGVTLSKRSRARALQLPAWNEALGLPRPWDQQWSLRIQQILAFESDLLEYGDIFDGSVVIETEDGRTGRGGLDRAGGRARAGRGLRDHRRAQVAGWWAARPTGSTASSRASSRSWGSTASPRRPTRRWPATTGRGSILKVDPAVESELRDDVVAWRADRDAGPVRRALDDLRRAAEGTDNLMPATIALAHAGGTTGEWAGALREVFGEYRAPTGIGGGVATGARSCGRPERTRALAERGGGPPRLLVAKPGLDGHSNGAEQIAVAARDAGSRSSTRGSASPRPRSWPWPGTRTSRS